ncbi:MAG: hypothetical protein QOD75_821 [Blastocatellia bacterium]|jgi:integrase|nr:hypothetical protein [Blastocatellia bacterium]
MKEITGYTYREEGRLYARITFTDENGKRRNLKRRAKNPANAKAILRELRSELSKGGAQAIEASRLTINDLCNFYCKHYLRPAEYVNERKVAGLRSEKVVAEYISVIRNHFGKRRLQSITYSDLLTFRRFRFETPTSHNKQRSLATVNRELSYLRRLLNIAEREGWTLRNPFSSGDSLINISDEKKRERVLSREEESMLLGHCIGRRVHLMPIIICALDTGMRRGEILKLRWRDVDFERQLITIQAFNTKTMRQRTVSMTIRLYQELEQLWLVSRRDSEALVFGITDTFKTAFKGVCKSATISDFRFHDLRHTHATRLDDLGFSLAKIGAQLGHTQLQTTLRYVNRDKASVQQVANALDGFYAVGDGDTRFLAAAQ